MVLNIYRLESYQFPRHLSECSASTLFQHILQDRPGDLWDMCVCELGFDRHLSKCSANIFLQHILQNRPEDLWLCELWTGFRRAFVKVLCKHILAAYSSETAWRLVGYVCAWTGFDTISVVEITGVSTTFVCLAAFGLPDCAPPSPGVCAKSWEIPHTEKPRHIASSKLSWKHSV